MGGIRGGPLLLDQIRERLNFPETLEAVRELTRKWPNAGAKLVEDEANGTIVIATPQHEIAGFNRSAAGGWQGGPRARGQSADRDVYPPHPSLAAWIVEYVGEWNSFPCGAHDDQVDATTQALHRLSIMPDSFEDATDLTE